MDLAQIRESKGLSQSQMAKLLNIGTSTYCQYETGKRNIPLNIVKEIENILGIHRKDIFLPTKFTISKQKEKV